MFQSSDRLALVLLQLLFLLTAWGLKKRKEHHIEFRKMVGVSTYLLRREVLVMASFGSPHCTPQGNKQ